MAWSVGNSAWADRVEGEDEVPPPPVLPAFAQEESFPTLGAAASMPQPTKKDKKKGGKPAKMSLADFNSGATTGSYKARGPSGGAYSSGYGRSKPNDDDILSQLPKGPAGYVQEEQGGIGGGFKEYGGNRGGGFGDRDRGREERRGFGDRDRDDREGGREEDMGPSRADVDNNWGSTRKFVPSDSGRGGGGFGGGGGFDRERRFDDRPPREEDMGPSRADESNNWGRDRKPLAPPPERHGGFADRYGPDRGPPRDVGPRPADSEDRWSRRGPPQMDDRRPHDDFHGKTGTEDRWSHRGPPPADDHRPPVAERPRLKLAPRTLPVEKPLPTRPDPEAHVADAPEAQPRPQKSNPFGAARPREEVLKEQGKDPVKEDLKLEASAFQRDDTPEEVALKEELEALKAKAEAGEDVKDEVDAKELEFQKLRLEINDKLRFSRRAADDRKQGSGASKEHDKEAAKVAPVSKGDAPEADEEA